MESELSPDKRDIPPVPIKTYQWEDLRRSREAGAYPWTHLLKPPLEGEITAEDIIRETTPRRSMSREVSRSRTHSPAVDVQKILNLDSSPGSSRKHGEEGEDEGVQIPNFSKEVSQDSEEDVINQTVNVYMVNRPSSQASTHLATPIEIPRNVSPKGILKRRAPDQHFIGVTETREKSKCCHPLVNKIKHLADKTLQKLEKGDTEKSPTAKRKKNEEEQEIRHLKSSPGAVRRQKFSTIKLGDSDEMSKTLSTETLPDRQKKEHIYEDIGELQVLETEKSLHFSPEVDKLEERADTESKNDSIKENESYSEKKSNASQDPSLVAEDSISLNPQEHIMEKLHKVVDNVEKEATLLDIEMDADEPNVDELFQDQLDENKSRNDSPNITITEIIDDEDENNIEHSTTIPIESSPSPIIPDIMEKSKEVEFPEKEWSKNNRRWTSEGGTPFEKPLRPTREGSVQIYTPEVRCGCQYYQCDSLLPDRVNPVGTRPTSRTSNVISFKSDHEYEIIEKPRLDITYSSNSINEKPESLRKTDDELSSTTSIERKYLRHTSDEEDPTTDTENLHEDKTENISEAEALQRDIEDRYFLSTPSSVSRTECEISTSQVDSSALENLPLKRENRSNQDSRIQQRIREGTGKLKTQAGKLKTKLQNIKSPKFTMPDRPKINMPERPRFKMPDRPKFSLPDRRKFSLPDRPKFKNINLSEKLSLGDRKKFSFPERPKFNVPELPKFKMPERPKINFSSLGRKKEQQIKEQPERSSDFKNDATTEFEVKTFPRIFSRKKRPQLPKTSSSPTLNREETPPPTFKFERVQNVKKESPSYIPDSPAEPREYGNVEETSYDNEGRKYDGRYNLDSEFMDIDEVTALNTKRNASSIPDISPSKQEYTHINEINNDEFFVRPRGISRENIQVREYLSDEIRQAFKIPKNALASMGSDTGINEAKFVNDFEDPELIDDNEPTRYSMEDVNERDDGYYTFPPVRPSRAKSKKREFENVAYIDESNDTCAQFSEVDLRVSEDRLHDHRPQEVVPEIKKLDLSASNELQSTHEYANDDIIEYPERIPVQAQTLPMPPKRKKKQIKDYVHSSLNDIKSTTLVDQWGQHQQHFIQEEVIVYRTEHEYIVPQAEATITEITEQSPVPPRRNRSQSSRGTSLCDDDRTSHGAESLTLDTNAQPMEEIEMHREIRHESPGYATVDKTSHGKTNRRSKSKTPPVRRRKSDSSERKYYTVGPSKPMVPDRPPRKKSSTSLLTLDSMSKRSLSGDFTQYAEIDEPEFDSQKDLKSGEVLSKMKDRPLPPPPPPPRESRRRKKNKKEKHIEEQTVRQIVKQGVTNLETVVTTTTTTTAEPVPPPKLQRKKSQSSVFKQSTTMLPQQSTAMLPQHSTHMLPQTSIPILPQQSTPILAPQSTTMLPPQLDEGVVEIEVSTQTDPLPDDIDFELGDEENIDISMSSMVDEDLSKSFSKLESPRVSRPTSRSEKSLKLSDPKISELSKSSIGRTSPTVILVERRVSSPTRINERDEMLTEASLTVQHIDVDESQIPDVPPLPRSRGQPSKSLSSTNAIQPKDERALERISSASRDIQLDNLITQRLQVRDLDVGRLNVSELQASKILVSDIEGMTLQVTELDSKSGHLSVSGIEFSQSVIDEIVKKFAEISTTTTQAADSMDHPIRPDSREEQTQTDTLTERKSEVKREDSNTTQTSIPTMDESGSPPQRPPPPDLTPLLYSYLQDISMPPAPLYHPRTLRERPFSEFHESQHQSAPATNRRAKRKTVHHSESSSDEERRRPSPRRAGSGPIKPYEPTITEAGAQFIRVCHNSISRTLRGMFTSFMSYISRTEDKKDMQMALVIFLVLIAGLIMFGLSDSRTIHHHHWEFFNPPDGKPL